MTQFGKLLATVLLGAAGPAHAALTWDATTVHCTAGALQKSVDVAFSFRNDGLTPVALQDIQTNCDCLVAGADRKSYAPGQSGLIVARFAVGERSGAHERSVFVRTDDPATTQRLQVHIDVPETAAVTPRTHDWPIGAAADEFVFDVSVATGLRVFFSEIFSSSEGFGARFETVEPGRRYRIIVRPPGTGEEASTAVRLLGKADTGEDVVISAYANVR